MAATARGTFRVLEWPGGPPAAVFLHGLTGVAEVWGPTIDALGEPRPRSFAIDQRGHGDSPVAGPYDVASLVRDLLAVLEALGVERPHLVGHSMGGRVALTAAARYPGRFRSVAIVDIGPEAWRANWRSTLQAFERMPTGFASMEQALAAGGRDEARRRLFLARLRQADGGGHRWHGDPDAWKAMVVNHRSHSYWRDWERLGAIPALLVRGGGSEELRSRVAAEMRRRNAHVDFVELPGVGHNVPLLEPAALAATLKAFWLTAGVEGA